MMVMGLVEMRKGKQRAVGWRVEGIQKHRHCIPRGRLQDVDFEATHCTNTGDRCTGVDEVRTCTYSGRSGHHSRGKNLDEQKKTRTQSLSIEFYAMLDSREQFFRSRMPLFLVVGCSE
jgi:hypothetical protein